jgi:hypothetical protein
MAPDDGVVAIFLRRRPATWASSPVPVDACHAVR